MPLNIKSPYPKPHLIRHTKEDSAKEQVFSRDLLASRYLLTKPGTVAALAAMEQWKETR